MDIKAFLTVFATVFLAELGDKTQLSTLFLASSGGRSKWVVFLASSCALVACSGLATLLGSALGQALSPKLLTTLAGVAFLVIGVLTLLQARVL